MNSETIDQIRQAITEHESNKHYDAQGFGPLFAASPQSKIVIVGQAPGIKAQASGLPWNDASGERLKKWLGVTDEQFRDTSLFAHIPMDFYYPGKGKSGDAPPRKEFAGLWHQRLLDVMPDVELLVPIGRYAITYYLPQTRKASLTETVYDYEQFLPDYFPLVHPSPLNFRWFKRNEWFEAEVVPMLQARVSSIINASTKN
jgi:uracil-DNA glycosylase